jgi:hypothetical protein
LHRSFLIRETDCTTQESEWPNTYAANNNRGKWMKASRAVFRENNILLMKGCEAQKAGSGDPAKEPYQYSFNAT